MGVVHLIKPYWMHHCVCSLNESNTSLLILLLGWPWVHVVQLPAPGVLSERCHLGDILQSLLQFRDKEERNKEIWAYLGCRCKVWPCLWLRTDSFLCTFFILCLISAWVRWKYIKESNSSSFNVILNYININARGLPFGFASEVPLEELLLYVIQLYFLWLMGWLFSIHSPTPHPPLPAASSMRAPHQIVGLDWFWRSKVAWSLGSSCQITSVHLAAGGRNEFIRTHPIGQFPPF